MWNNIPDLSRVLLALFSAFSFGLMSAGGVFTALTSVGLIPRFAGRTHTADHILLYESMAVIGSISGCIISVFPISLAFLLPLIARILLCIYGIFTGIFVGCLAISIAEMLNSIPIFCRRIGFRKGLSYAILFMGLGKAAGSLLYFIWKFY